MDPGVSRLGEGDLEKEVVEGGPLLSEHGYHQQFSSYPTSPPYTHGYYAHHDSTSLYNPMSDWTEYISRMGKQDPYPTHEEPASFVREESPYFAQSRPIDSYSVHYSPQYATGQQYTDGQQYYQPYQTGRSSSYTLSPGYPQHYLQPIDQYAHIFPGVLPEAKAKTEQKQYDEAYSPGLYRVTNSFSQLSFSSDGMTNAQGLVNGAVVSRIPPLSQATPAPEAVPQATPATSAEPQKMTYADVVTGPRGPARARLPVTQTKSSGSFKPTASGTVQKMQNGPLGYRKRVTQVSQTQTQPQTSQIQTSQTQSPSETQTQTQTQTQTAQPPQTQSQAGTLLAQKLGVNPETFDTNPTFARFFVIKSYSADDVHKSIKYGVWTSTKHGNKRLDQAYRESSSKGPIYLFFSVNGSGCFCGLAQMTSALDFEKTFAAWAQDDKWSGQFSVKWIYIKNIPNKRLRPIRLVNNNNKSVTNSRDTQEVFLEPGKQVLKVFHTFEHSFSILDDFETFDRLEEKKKTDKEQKPVSKSEGLKESVRREQKPRGLIPKSSDFVPVHGDIRLRPRQKLNPGTSTFSPVGAMTTGSYKPVQKPRAIFQVKAKPKPNPQS